MKWPCLARYYVAQYQAYGEIGKRYAAKMQDIYITEADVTNDGIPEKILGGFECRGKSHATPVSNCTK